MIALVPASSGVPDSTAREALMRGTRSNEARTRVSALVHEATGFSAAAIRAVSAGSSAALKNYGRQRMYGTVSQAAAWLSTLDIESVADPGETVAAVAEARASASSAV